MMITFEDFETKALQVLLSQKFLTFPLFKGEKISRYNITDSQDEMDLEDFLSQFYMEITLKEKELLKDYMISILTELRSNIQENDCDIDVSHQYKCGFKRKESYVNELIQEQINALKGDTK